MISHKFLRTLCICMLSLGVSSPVKAYFTDFGTKVNEVSPGYNETYITEEFPMPSPIPEEEDSIITKRVQIYNPSSENSVECYVRVRILKSNNIIGDAVEFINLDTSNWIYDENDEFYYYRHIVAPGEYTTPVFTAIKISADLLDKPSLPLIDGFTIDVYEESIQASGRDYRSAWDLSNHQNEEDI